MTVMSMSFVLRQEYFPRMIVRYVFPVRGHSFLSADIVFDRIEKELHKINEILLTTSKYCVTTGTYMCTTMTGLHSTTRLQRNQF